MLTKDTHEWIMYGICAIDSDNLHVFEGLAIVKTSLQGNIDIPKIATTIPSGFTKGEDSPPG